MALLLALLLCVAPLHRIGAAAGPESPIVRITLGAEGAISERRGVEPEVLDHERRHSARQGQHQQLQQRSKQQLHESRGHHGGDLEVVAVVRRAKQPPALEEVVSSGRGRDGSHHRSNNSSANETEGQPGAAGSKEAMSSAAAPTLLSFAVLLFFAISQFSALRSGAGQLEEETDEARAPRLSQGPSGDTGSTEAMPAMAGERPERSVLSIVAITCYKFYMGFLNSTWLPFLIAKEGLEMMPDRQSLFMGIFTLIYGCSMVMNPALGLLSDRLSAQGQGRTAFLSTGVLMEGVALMSARIASQNHELGWFMAATCSWVIGEAFVDVVVEALPLDALPPSQFKLASSIRSLHFFAGGLAGYVALYFFHELHYEWIYYGYLVVMLACSLPTVATAAMLTWGQRAARRPAPLGYKEIFDSYVAPLSLPGSFPAACLATFIFCLSSAPMFFTLLLVRDLVGVTDESPQQRIFSAASVVFLAAAAISAMIIMGSGGRLESLESDQSEAEPQLKKGEAVDDRPSSSSSAPEAAPDTAGSSVGPVASPPTGGEEEEAPEASEAEAVMLIMLLFWILAYGLLCLVGPAISWPTALQSRINALYVFSALLGFAFGSVYSHFKVCTWIMLPQSVDVDAANAMGVAAVAQILGTGLGNFGGAAILDLFGEKGTGESHYPAAGYFAVGCACAAAVLGSAAVMIGIIRARRIRRPRLRKLLCCC